jgi:succinoglycan biosynthesis transport protein ExoP
MLKRASDNNAVNTAPSQTANNPSTQSSFSEDLQEYVRIARRRAPLVMLLALIGLVLGIAYSMRLTPLYTASATLILDTQGKNVVDGAAVVTGIGTNNSAIESEVELIKSYDVAERVVNRLKLDELEYSSATPSLLRRVLGLVFSREEPTEPVIQSDTKDAVIRGVQSAVVVERKGWTYVIDIRYTSPNPALAAQITNAFADEYLVDRLESTYEATRRANEWLSGRLSDLREKVRASEQAVELFKAQNNIVDTGQTTLSEQQIAKLNEQLILARAETAQARAKYQQVQAVRKRGGDVTAFADALQSSALGALKSKGSEVRRELANLSAKYGNRHPSVVSARAQLSDIQRQIGSEATRIVTAVRNDFNVAQSREASIEASLSEMKGSQTNTNQATVKLRELEREAEANKALFESFLARFKQTSEQENLQTNDSRIIERAATPTRPSAPNKKMIALAGLIGGLGLGVVIAFLLEQLDSGFRTNRQIEQRLGVPVLASVPRADGELAPSGIGGVLHKINPFGWLFRLFRRGGEPDRRMGRSARVNMSRLVTEKPFSTFTEAIRSLRMGIKFADIDRPQKVILMTSALPGEGKSTIASNLAQHAANAGERVLLIDLDLRHPVLTSLYAPEAEIGSVELLMGEADLKQVIIKDPRSGLHVIPSPRRANLTHTAELLGSQRLKDLLAHLSDYYDLVIVDTSPLLPVTDGRALIEAVDSLVLVVRWEKTAKDAVEAALKQSLGSQDKLVGVVLNDVVANKARYYDYYKSGYYNKKYPYYYGGSK